MKVDIRADPQASAAFLRAHVERRLRPVLKRLGGVVTSVAVEVGDENGPRGGVDKYCGVSADLAGLPSVFVESIDADMGAAIDRSTRRFERAVRRTVVRSRERTRESARTSLGKLAQEG